MSDYFKPWRRKIAVVVLLLACVFVIGWIRSKELTDELTISAKRNRVSMVSVCDTLMLKHGLYDRTDLDHAFHCECRSSPIRQTYKSNGANGLILVYERRRRERFGFELETGRCSECGSETFAYQSMTFPYWFIVALPTLISCGLLFCKPRKSQQPTEAGKC